jgi:hypothetical protein
LTPPSDATPLRDPTDPPHGLRLTVGKTEAHRDDAPTRAPLAVSCAAATSMSAMKSFSFAEK